MTFKLGAHCNDVGDPRLLEQLYQSYIEHNRWRIPQSALAVIAHADWVGGYIWSITAREIEVQWRLYEHAIDEDLCDAEKRMQPAIQKIAGQEGAAK